LNSQPIGESAATSALFPLKNYLLAVYMFQRTSSSPLPSTSLQAVPGQLYLIFYFLKPGNSCVCTSTLITFKVKIDYIN
jgi:hypothetical protein